jgi:PleD family two-component response regulator
VGIARFEPESSASIEELLAKADEALYEHKRAKRKRT